MYLFHGSLFWYTLCLKSKVFFIYKIFAYKIKVHIIRLKENEEYKLSVWMPMKPKHHFLQHTCRLRNLRRQGGLFC